MDKFDEKFLQSLIDDTEAFQEKLYNKVIEYHRRDCKNEGPKRSLCEGFFVQSVMVALDIKLAQIQEKLRKADLN